MYESMIDPRTSMQQHRVEEITGARLQERDERRPDEGEVSRSEDGESRNLDSREGRTRERRIFSLAHVGRAGLSRSAG